MRVFSNDAACIVFAGHSRAQRTLRLLFLRSQYEDGSATRGKWAVPNEAAILVGGRLAENRGDWLNGNRFLS